MDYLTRIKEKAQNLIDLYYTPVAAVFEDEFKADVLQPDKTKNELYELMQLGDSFTLSYKGDSAIEQKLSNLFDSPKFILYVLDQHFPKIYQRRRTSEDGLIIERGKYDSLYPKTKEYIEEIRSLAFDWFKNVVSEREFTQYCKKLDLKEKICSDLFSLLDERAFNAKDSEFLVPLGKILICRWERYTPLVFIDIEDIRPSVRNRYENNDREKYNELLNHVDLIKECIGVFNLSEKSSHAIQKIEQSICLYNTFFFESKSFICIKCQSQLFTWTEESVFSSWSEEEKLVWLQCEKCYTNHKYEIH